MNEVEVIDDTKHLKEEIKEIQEDVEKAKEKEAREDQEIEKGITTIKHDQRDIVQEEE
jgi:cell division protein ZapA (FtsZ GTPase activity inhibitor)